MSDVRIKPIWWMPEVRREERKGINEDRCHFDPSLFRRENSSKSSKWTVDGRCRVKKVQAEVLEQ